MSGLLRHMSMTINGGTALVKRSWFHIALSACLLPVLPAQAGTWMICRLEVQVLETVKKPRPSIRVTVGSAIPVTSEAECPVTGSILDFEPESFDYQTMLPKRQWPRAGRSLKMRYLYLDGICKNDGDPRPCRIEHYPVGW